jgi:hypothetical protein
MRFNGISLHTALKFLLPAIASLASITTAIGQYPTQQRVRLSELFVRTPRADYQRLMTVNVSLEPGQTFSPVVVVLPISPGTLSLQCPLPASWLPPPIVSESTYRTTTPWSSAGMVEQPGAPWLRCPGLIGPGPMYREFQGTGMTQPAQEGAYPAKY